MKRSTSSRAHVRALSASAVRQSASDGTPPALVRGSGSRDGGGGRKAHKNMAASKKNF